MSVDIRMVNLDVMCGMYKLSLNPQEWPSQVTAYHLTQAGNVESILENGLAAKSCQATFNGPERSAAVYMLAHKGDATDGNIRKFLFGADTDIVILKVEIPSSAFENLQDDGLFNMSCTCADGSFPFGVRYTGDIPADWISRQ